MDLVSNGSGRATETAKFSTLPPAFSLLLQSYGTPTSEDIGVLSTSEQWLWYFYITVWARPFFVHSSQQHRDICSGNEKVSSSDQMPTGSKSFEELMVSVQFPASAVIVELEKQWRTRANAMDDVWKQVTTAAEAATVGNNSGDVYPPLPRVTETSFGRILRSLAVRDYLSFSANSSSPFSCTEKLVKKVLSIVDVYVRHHEVEVAVGTEEGSVWKSALQTMLFGDSTVPPSAASHGLLFDVERTTLSGISDSKKLEEDAIAEAHQARLFAALAVEIFGRVKTTCANFLLAYVNQISGILAAARVCGVVTGIVEYAIAYRFCREDGTGRCPLANAVLLLHSLVELQDTLVRDRKGEGTVTSCIFATNIVACMQELLFAIVVGGSVTPHRSLPATQVDRSKARSGDVQDRKCFALQNECSIRPIVLRALTLHEVDALLQTLLPALLQQIGFEWPWSESLRRCRFLDKMQQGTMVVPDGVRLSSRAVFEQLLVALGRRTYMARLRNILPQSYDTFFDVMFPKEVQKGDGNGNGNGEQEVVSDQRIRFAMPAYYRTVGEALVEFFERSGLSSSTTAEEVERVLQRSTDVHPMIIQIQALGCSFDNDDNEDIRGNFSASGELLRTSRLSMDEKHRLLLRYRCEVLLASVVVYTQLQTVSMVQQLIRRLTPLFEKLLLPLLHKRTLNRPFVMAPRNRSAEMGDKAIGGSVLEFTPEFKVLMDEIQYGFYPLEWIPEALNAHQGVRGVEELEPSSFAFYSVFAAVAYHFGLFLHGSPQGLRGGDGTDHSVRIRAYRFCTTLMLNNLVDTLTSSCEMEGEMALRATRRVCDKRMPNNIFNSNEDHTDGDGCDAEFRRQRQPRGAMSFHAIVKPHDVVFTLAQCLLPVELASCPTLETNSHRMSEEWLRRALDWAQLTISKWTLQKQQRNAEAPCVSPSLLNTSLMSQWNSLTFDSIPLAREIIRAVWRRLLEKMHVASLGGSAPPDPLLQQHLVHLRTLLETIGLLPQCPPQTEGTFSAAQLLWMSPFFSRELQISAYYAQEN